MEFYTLVRDIKNFLKGNLSQDKLVERLESLEDRLLDMDEESSNTDKKTRDIILKALEVLDNIHMLLDELNVAGDNQIKEEMEKLIKLDLSFKDELEAPPRPAISGKARKFTPLRPAMSPEARSFPPPITDISDKARRFVPPPPDRADKVRSFPPPVLKNKYNTKTPKKFTPPGASPHNRMEKLILSQPEFNVHHHIKNRLPGFKWSEGEDTAGLELKSSPLYHLLEVAKRYASLGESLSEFTAVLEDSYKEIINIKEEENYYEDNENYENSSEMLEEILKKLSEMKVIIKTRKAGKELAPFIDEIEKLNRKFIKVRKKMAIPSEEIDNKELLEKVKETIPEKAFETSNYLLIKNNSLKFSEGELDLDEFISSLDKMKELIQSSREEYEKTYVSEDEWTIEVSAGDKILIEGLGEWEDILYFLEECSENDKTEEIIDSMERLYEANKKLVLNQYLAEYIKEQAKINKRYKTLGHFLKS